MKEFDLEGAVRGGRDKAGLWRNELNTPATQSGKQGAKHSQDGLLRHNETVSTLRGNGAKRKNDFSAEILC